MKNIEYIINKLKLENNIDIITFFPFEMYSCQSLKMNKFTKKLIFMNK